MPARDDLANAIAAKNRRDIAEHLGRCMRLGDAADLDGAELPDWATLKAAIVKEYGVDGYRELKAAARAGEFEGETITFAKGFDGKAARVGR